MTKRLILNNWAAKLVSLLLALALWFLIRKNVELSGGRTDGHGEWRGDRGGAPAAGSPAVR